MDVLLVNNVIDGNCHDEIVPGEAAATLLAVPATPAFACKGLQAVRRHCRS